jgi:type II secretory pathway pseudopilin PulG
VKLFAAPRRRSKRGQEDGYILLTLLLVVALMGIFALAASQLMKIQFEIQRDQEQEMIHRGVQYSRAIRGYYKKFGRYPTKLEDLDNTNNLRYLRKHYKDPLNKNKDFKLLHFGDPGVTLAGGIAGATPAGSPAGLNGLNPSAQSNSAFGSPSGNSAFGGSGNSGVNQSGVFAQSSGLGSSSNSASGANASQSTTNQSGTSGTTPAAGTDPTQAAAGTTGTAPGDTNSSSSSQPFAAGGPIVGVASLVKKDTIRLFNKKKQYNEWQFVYDPSFDRGGLITTPYQPSLLTAATNNLQPNSTNGSTSSSPFGQSSSGQSSFGQSSFGQSGQSGFGNNSNTNTPAPPAQPSTNSSQQ